MEHRYSRRRSLGPTLGGSDLDLLGRSRLFERRAWLARGTLANSDESPVAVLAKARNCLGRLEWRLQDYTNARNRFESAAANFDSIGDHQGLAEALFNLGSVDLYLANYPSARARFEQSLALSQRSGRADSVAMALGGLGLVVWRLEDLTMARSLLGESLSLFRQLGDVRNIARTIDNLATIAQFQGDYAVARSLHTDSLAIYVQLDDRMAISLSLLLLARTAWGQQQSLRAVHLLGAEMAQRRKLGIVGVPFLETEFAHLDAALRSELGEETFVAAWSKGKAMTQEQAIAYALGEETAEGNGSAAPAGSQPAGREAGLPRRRSEQRWVAGPPEGTKDLTLRESQVLRLIAAGRNNKEMARELNLSTRPIERHITNIYAKIGARGKADAIAYALRLENRG
ncbi:MAG: tetratricopeptide repeat protein [Dehalococcoidia bacterium]